eukprot:sb/3475261/
MVFSMEPVLKYMDSAKNNVLNPTPHVHMAIEEIVDFLIRIYRCYEVAEEAGLGYDIPSFFYPPALSLSVSCYRATFSSQKERVHRTQRQGQEILNKVGETWSRELEGYLRLGREIGNNHGIKTDDILK